MRQYSLYRYHLTLRYITCLFYKAVPVFASLLSLSLRNLSTSLPMRGSLWTPERPVAAVLYSTVTVDRHISMKVKS